MKQVTNIHDRPLTIAATGQTVAPGDVVDVADELADRLVDQPARWRPAPSPSPADKKPTTKRTKTATPADDTPKEIN